VRSRTATTVVRSSSRSSERTDPVNQRLPGFDAPARRTLRVFCDGGSRGNPGPSAIGAVVLDPSTDPPTQLATVSEYIGEATNNVAEYKALIAGLEAAARFGARRVHVRADSLLVIEQMRGTWKIKHANMRPLAAEARRLLAPYDHVVLEHVPREQNTEADLLVNAALDAL
jgi:ribonuclease HI